MTALDRAMTDAFHDLPATVLIEHEGEWRWTTVGFAFDEEFVQTHPTIAESYAHTIEQAAWNCIAGYTQRIRQVN